MLKNPLFAEDSGESFYFSGGSEGGSSLTSPPGPSAIPPPPPLPPNLFGQSAPKSTPTPAFTPATIPTAAPVSPAPAPQPPPPPPPLHPPQPSTSSGFAPSFLKPNITQEKQAPKKLGVSVLPNLDSSPKRSALRSPTPESTLSSSPGRDNNFMRQVSFTPSTVDNELTAKKYAKDSISSPVSAPAPAPANQNQPIYDSIDALHPDTYTSPETGEGSPGPFDRPKGIHVHTISLTDHDKLQTNNHPSGNIPSISSNLPPQPLPPLIGQSFPPASENIRIETVQFYVDEQGREVNSHRYPQWNQTLPENQSTGASRGNSAAPSFIQASSQLPAGSYGSMPISGQPVINGYSGGTTVPLNGNSATQNFGNNFLPASSPQPGGPYISTTTLGPATPERSHATAMPYHPAEVHSGPTSTVVIGTGLSDNNKPVTTHDYSLQGTTYTNYPRETTKQQPPVIHSYSNQNGFVPPTIIPVGNDIADHTKGKSVEVRQEQYKVNGTVAHQNHVHSHHAHGNHPKHHDHHAHGKHQHHMHLHGNHQNSQPRRQKQPFMKSKSNRCKLITGITLIIIAIAIGIGIAIFVTYYK